MDHIDRMYRPPTPMEILGALPSIAHAMAVQLHTDARDAGVNISGDVEQLSKTIATRLRSQTLAAFAAWPGAKVPPCETLRLSKRLLPLRHDHEAAHKVEKLAKLADELDDLGRLADTMRRGGMLTPRQACLWLQLPRYTVVRRLPLQYPQASQCAGLVLDAQGKIRPDLYDVHRGKKTAG